MQGQREKGITELDHSMANEGRRKPLCEIGKTGFPQEERTPLINSEERGPVERRPETSTLTG